MGARLTDSALYAHLWGTEELREVFDERQRLQAWLDILVALAQAQAEYGVIPEQAAQVIAAGADADRLDLAFVAAETRRTGHSTLGLIHGLRAILPEAGGQWIYHAATVQDVTDTWMALVFRRVGTVAWRQLRAVEAGLLGLAEIHRDTPMCGRTHGQPGAPITFGLKAAAWADEVRRQLDRLREALPRLGVGQLGGAVGTLAAFGPHGLEVRRRFCERVGLADPGIAWLASRDRPAEMTGLLAMITGTLARVGNEVVELSRPEIGELAESVPPGVVGSITMPHKVNPEVAEHLVTLARLVRAQHAVVLEGLVAEGERDGRGWKAEWVAVPEACLLAGAALEAGRKLVTGLAVRPEAMRANLEARLGTADTGASAAMVDLVVRRARAARAAEPEVWA